MVTWVGQQVTVRDLRTALDVDAPLVVEGVPRGEADALDEVLEHDGVLVGIAPPANGQALSPLGPVRRRAVRTVVSPSLELDTTAPSARPGSPPPVPWLSLAAPLLGGAVMVVFIGSTALVFAGLGSLMSAARWTEQYVAHRRAKRTHRAELASLADQLRTSLVAQRDRYRRTAWGQRRGLAVRRSWIDGSRPGLWSRHPSDAGALEVVLGIGAEHVRWSNRPLTDLGIDPDEDRWSRIDGVPRSVDLADGGLAVVGRRLEDRRAAIATVVLQLASQLGPADLEVGTVGSGHLSPMWMWWLPHRSRVEDWPRRATAMARIAVGDESDGWDDSPLVRWLERSETPLVVGVASPDRVPVGCRWVLDLDAGLGVGEVRDLSTSSVVILQRVQGCDPAEAADLAWRIGRRSDDQIEGQTGIPDTASLEELSGLGAPDGGTSGRSALWAPVGLGAGGPCWVDLVGHGPHVLVAGTTGSGKSELLCGWLAGLGERYDPAGLRLVLFDFKGGGGLDAVARLPQCCSLVTDLESGLAWRALRSLSAELRRREEVVRTAGVTDIADAPLDVDIDRLVVVIDEFAVLVDEVPAALPLLVDVAQRGRSLGVHLVLATQRPAGVVDPRIRANTNLRICLRVQNDRDAEDVVGVSEPARFPVELPGRALLVVGGGDGMVVQGAFGGGQPRPRLELRTPAGELRGMVPAAAGVHRTSMGTAVAAARTRWDRTRWGDTPWLAPLPARSPAEVPVGRGSSNGDRSPSARRIGIIDEPDLQRQRELWWDPTSEHLLVVGGAGRSGFLHAAVAAACSGIGPGALHCYVVAPNGDRLAALATYPHCGGVVDPADVDRCGRLFDLLDVPAEVPRVVVIGDAGWCLQRWGEARIGGLQERLEALVDSATTARVALGIADGRGLSPTVIAGSTVRVSLPPVAPERLGALWPAHLAPSSLGDLGLDLVSGQPVSLLADVDPADPGLQPWGIEPPELPSPPRIPEIPDPLTTDHLGQRTAVRRGRWLDLPVGLSVDRVLPVHMTIDEIGVVVGRPGSGRSTTLAVLGQQAQRAGVRVGWVAGGSERPPIAVDALVRFPGETRASAEWLQDAEMWLVDEADELDERDGAALVAWARQGSSRWVVVGLRPDGLRDGLSWRSGCRTAGATLLLAPRAADADRLGLKVPLRSSVHTQGEGVLTEGDTAQRIRVARLSPS